MGVTQEPLVLKCSIFHFFFNFQSIQRLKSVVQVLRNLIDLHGSTFYGMLQILREIWSY